VVLLCFAIEREAAPSGKKEEEHLSESLHLQANSF
jgi:hypothetical protein